MKHEHVVGHSQGVTWVGGPLNLPPPGGPCEARALISPDEQLKRAHANDPVHHPKHYTSHPSGVECIAITEHFGFNLGNVIKYLWRAEEKGAPIQDLEKARWYLDREIQKRKREAP